MCLYMFASLLLEILILAICAIRRIFIPSIFLTLWQQNIWETTQDVFMILKPKLKKSNWIIRFIVAMILRNFEDHHVSFSMIKYNGSISWLPNQKPKFLINKEERPYRYKLLSILNYCSTLYTLLLSLKKCLGYATVIQIIIISISAPQVVIWSIFLWHSQP